MKSIIAIVVVVLAFMSSALHAGFSGLDATVSIDFDEGVASGNMWFTRSSKNNIEVIGCSQKGATTPDESPWWPAEDVYRWAWCRAVDANDVHVLCLTKDPKLIAILMVGLIGKFSRTQAFVVITYAVIELAANIVARTELGALAPI